MTQQKPNTAIIKTTEEIAMMRTAGKLTAQVLAMIRPHVVPGITTEALNTLCHAYITEELDCIPAPLGYHGFPKSICTSINHVVCHGIPKPSEKLKDGDIINIDISVIKDDFHGDSSQMFFVGTPSPQAEKIVRITYECLLKGAETVKNGSFLGDIGYAIAQHAKKNGCSVVRDFCGHGIGRGFHEPPQVLHYGKKHTGEQLRTGMTFTIEPMINLGTHRVKILKDGWTAITADKSLSAQWEHTFLVTETGYEILTAWDHDPIETHGWNKGL